MTETHEATTELISPARADSWGDSPPLIGTNSPFEEDMFRKTPPPVSSAAHHSESKDITDGFLSEVSTPDHGSKHQKQTPPREENESHQTPYCVSPQQRFTEDESQYRNIFNISPQQALSDKSGQLNRDEKFDTEENLFFFPSGKFEDVLQDSHISAAASETNNAVKEEARATNEDSCEASDTPFICDATSRIEYEQSNATTLKRKYFLANEGKPERKRHKSSISERPRAKANTQWSHLSEEELKKLRRVKNRESVERCRTKQRLRMEALQVEQTCLRLENKNLREATTLIRAALKDVTMEMTRFKRRNANNDKEHSRNLQKELRRKIRAGIETMSTSSR